MQAQAAGLLVVRADGVALETAADPTEPARPAPDVAPDDRVVAYDR